ncbi:hypothetical protein ONB79_00720 [Candidatus Vidania fulgoroideae]|nr:hypothetical protein ONB79_00720 [Candidatus Vidania fulgoroideae]WDR79273.1 hypothetical protein ONB65_00085 [Candidatus Vidania fulgoroideae]
MNIKGQNFLKKNFCSLISKKICIHKKNKIIELASGYGNFTKFLKKKVNSRILEFEIDNLFKNNKINENIININFRIYGRILIFGNIPYNITTKIIKKILLYRNIKDIYIMLQIDFIKKIYFFYKKIFSYKKMKNTCFIPSPKIESCFVKISNYI